ncbi:nuclear transport factor 2 family protein [Planosporangium mesophilum]|uniref:SnoaL-like domain-containing protein n=1 Tax=Planosporangium mesophilum TaxID=689768 RepID=A0A8J3X0J6_9ACTN|nr:nuclear transport factor 2 family protein [Planosporangium mesophilum]NJC83867.1 nuclear transport factor 2 family protein [Planosporangium mesophilum]GII22776.1 hypothetical protein Pme01_23730 [Planosporangium mesophilum]
MAISAEDRIAINDLIALHGHLMDAGELDRLDELFSPEVVYDLGDFGLGPLQGIEAIRDAAIALGDRNPVGHHVTNVILTEMDEHAVQVRSKGIGIQADGSSGSVVYDDIVQRGPGGWRIAYRKVTARRTPLTA